MIYYYLIIIIITSLYLVLNIFVKNNKKNFIFLNVSFLILFLFLALRANNVGTDLKNYKEIFNLCNYFSLKRIMSIFEPGFALYLFCMNKISGSNFHIFLAVTSFFSLMGPYIFIRDNSNNYFMSIMLFICLGFYLFMFSGLRQALAISITLYSYKYIKGKSMIKFLLCIFIASLFHKSSIIFIPAYFISNVNITSKHIPILLGILLFVFIFRYQIMAFFTNFMYGNYLKINDANGGYKLLSVYLIIFTFITMYKNIFSKASSDNNALYNSFFIGIIIQILSTVQGNAYRASYYYILPLIVLLPSLLNCFNKNSRLLANIVLCILLVLIFTSLLHNSSLVGAYDFIWNE